MPQELFLRCMHHGQVEFLYCKTTNNSSCACNQATSSNFVKQKRSYYQEKDFCNASPMVVNNSLYLVVTAIFLLRKNGL